MKRGKTLLFMAGLLPAMFLGPLGCETMERHRVLSGTAIGTAAGAGLGAVIGHQTGNTGAGALIGGAVGAGLGAGVGYMLERQARAFDRIEGLEVEARRAREEREADTGRVVVQERERLVLRMSNQLFFERGSSSLSPQGTQKLREIADILNQYPDSEVLVKGYASAEGSDAGNVSLSERRARNVKNTLVGYGVDDRRIRAMGLGASSPQANNATASGRTENRRVEIEVLPTRTASQQQQQAPRDGYREDYQQQPAPAAPMSDENW